MITNELYNYHRLLFYKLQSLLGGRLTHNWKDVWADKNNIESKYFTRYLNCGRVVSPKCIEPNKW